MPLTLVTGASGFLGWHVARLAVERGDSVRVLCRPSSRIRELDAERISGDLRDPESLARAVKGCELVFHVAADYRLWSKHPLDLYASNVEGTRNLLEACAHARVGRIVYTSTVGCIGMPQDSIGDEATPAAIDDMAGYYKRSKWLAEQEALAAAQSGQHLPTIVPRHFTFSPPLPAHHRIGRAGQGRRPQEHL